MPELTDNFAGELLANRLNLSPYIGHGYENYPQVWCHRNFSVIDHAHPLNSFQDSEGKWVLYFSATMANGLVRAFKSYVTEEYPSDAVWLNEPMHPSFAGENEVVRSVLGVGTYYVVLELTDDTPDQNPTRTVVVKTQSSYPGDWTDYVDVTNHVAQNSRFGYDHESGNILHVWTENNRTEIWFAVLNPTAGAQLMTPRQLIDLTTDIDYVDSDAEFDHQGADGQVKPGAMSITYDRVNEELLIGFRCEVEVLDTVSGALVVRPQDLILNRSLTEAEMKIGQGALVNNVPYGQDNNYQFFPDISGSGGVLEVDFFLCSTLGFNEYYQGTTYLVLHDMNSHPGQVSVSKRGLGESLRGYSNPADNYWFEIKLEDQATGFSGVATKAVYAVNTLLVPVGRPTLELVAPVVARVARIEEGDIIRLNPDYSGVDITTEPGKAMHYGHRLTVVKTGATAKTYFFADDGTIYQMAEEAGGIVWAGTGLIVPVVPTHFHNQSGWTFDGSLTDPTFYFLVSPVAWDGSPDQGETVIAAYNTSYPDVGYGEGWKLFTTKLDPEGVAESKAANDSLYPLPRMNNGLFSGTVGMFTDQSHVVFSTYWAGSDHTHPGTTDPTVSVFDPATDSLVSSIRVKAGTGTQTQGWHEDLGYYAVDEITPTGVKIKAQGDATYSDFWSGAASTEFFLPLDYSYGDTFEIDEMEILLGGRFSVFPSFSGAIPLDQTSYIYLERDTEAPYDIQVRIEAGLLPNTWRRVLIAKIEADDIGPISQTTYPVNWRT